MMAFGVVLGRAICGLLCPFGLVQDLLHKIPLPKYQLPPQLDRALRWLKYIVLALLVVLLPLLVAIQSGIATPYFCKWLCPAGTLGGAAYGDESFAACAGGCALWLEICGAGADRFRGNPDPAAVLPLPLSTGSVLQPL